MSKITAGWASAIVSFVAMILGVIAAIYNARITRRRQSLPHRIKVTQDRTREIPFSVIF